MKHSMTTRYIINSKIDIDTTYNTVAKDSTNIQQDYTQRCEWTILPSYASAFPPVQPPQLAQAVVWQTSRPSARGSDGGLLWQSSTPETQRHQLFPTTRIQA